jgi:hypothetical protein
MVDYPRKKSDPLQIDKRHPIYNLDQTLLKINWDDYVAGAENPRYTMQKHLSLMAKFSEAKKLYKKLGPEVADPIIAEHKPTDVEMPEWFYETEEGV